MSRIYPGDGDKRHGTWNGYHNCKCRCQLCRDAWAVHVAERRQVWRARGLDPADPRHGKVNTYLNYACRCAACTSARTEYAREQRAAS
jgi:hypothetical protein